MNDLLREAIGALRQRVDEKMAHCRPDQQHIFVIQRGVIAEAEWVLNGCIGPPPGTTDSLTPRTVPAALYSVLCELSWNFPGAHKKSDKLAAAYLGWSLPKFHKYCPRGRSPCGT